MLESCSRHLGFYQIIDLSSLVLRRLIGVHTLSDLRREGGYEQKDLLPLVRDWWISTEVHGFARFQVANKLHFIKIRIKEWKSMVGRVDQVSISAMKEFEKWELVEEKRVARDVTISIVGPQLGTVKISWR